VFGLSFGEVVLLMIIAIVVVGPRNLPQMMRGVGRTVTRIRRMTVELREQSGIDEILRAEGIEKEVSDLRKLATGRILDVDYYEDEPRRSTEPALPPRSKEYPVGGVDVYGATEDGAYARQLEAPEEERVGRGGRGAILATPEDAPVVTADPVADVAPADGANAPPLLPSDTTGRSAG
jgi:sec-independent protein translocase protein TatB